MSLNEPLNKALLEQKIRFASIEFNDFLASQRFETRNKEPDLVNSFSLNFLGAYYVIKDSLEQKKPDLNETASKIYCSAISADLLLQRINYEEEDIIYADIDGLLFSGSDYESNLNILKRYTDMLTTYSYNPRILTASYFYNLKSKLTNILFTTMEEEEIDSIGDFTFSNGRSSNVKKKDILLKKNAQRNLEEVTFAPTRYEDIIGNTDAKDDLESSIKKLFLYNADLKKNPAHEMNQFKHNYLLEGEPGNGKGMLAAFAATLGKELSEKYKKKFRIVSFESNSDYQDGPILKLIDYLKEISYTDDLFLVVLDEIDAAFASRSDERTQNYQKKLTTELLKFTCNSVGYINKGNYVLISMTNVPDALDKAFISRTNANCYVCEGPKSPAEKSALFKKMLNELVQKELIKINDWETIGRVAQSYNLSGRDIKGCVSNLFDKHSKKKIPNNIYDISYADQIAFFKNIKEIKDKDLVNEINYLGSKKIKKNYLK